MGVVLVRGIVELFFDFFWGVVVVFLFFRRIFSVVGTNRVIFVLGLVICGLVLMVVVVFFLMVVAFVLFVLGRWIKLGGVFKISGFGKGVGGKSLGGVGLSGGIKGGRIMLGRGGGIFKWRRR